MAVGSEPSVGKGLQHNGPGTVAAVVPASSPRPSFDQPTHIPYADATLHLWGDADSGQVPDWIYVSSEKIHHLVFGLPPGGMFRHSQEFRTVFAADELMYVLSGTMVIADPEHGEVHRVERGDSIFFRRDTWHHAMNFGADQLRVLEFFAPPPAAGTSSAYARTKDYLAEPTYRDRRWNGRWPMASAERAKASRMTVLGPADRLASLDGDGAFVETLVSTEHITAGTVTIPAGGRTQPRRHGGDATFHVLEGRINVLLTDGPDRNGRRWFELQPEDGFFVPQGSGYELRNVTAAAGSVMFAVAPTYDED